MAKIALKQNFNNFLGKLKKIGKDDDNASAYLYRVEEIRRWLEMVLEEVLPQLADFEPSLLNGVVVCKLGRRLLPQHVRSIMDMDQSVYKAKGITRQHHKNLQAYLNMLEALKLPKVFIPSEDCLVARKDTLKLVYSLHALSHFCLINKTLRVALKEIGDTLDFDPKLKKRCSKALLGPDVSRELVSFVTLADIVEEELQYDTIIEFECDGSWESPPPSPPNPKQQTKSGGGKVDHGYETVKATSIDSPCGGPIAELQCAQDGVRAVVYKSKPATKVPTLKDGALYVINAAVLCNDGAALASALLNPQAELPYVQKHKAEMYLHALAQAEKTQTPESLLCVYRGLTRESSEELLEKMTPGAYILRQSVHGKIIFSFRNHAGIKHWKMIEREKRFYMSFSNPSDSYESLGSLLKYFLPLLEAKTHVNVHSGSCTELDLVNWQKVPALKDLSEKEGSLSHEQITAVVNAVNARIHKERAGSIESVQNKEMAAVEWRDDMIINASRVGAELLLKKYGQPGSFVVRPSLSCSNDFAIAFRTQHDLCHWRIARQEGCYTITPRPRKYKNMTQVIQAFVYQVQDITGLEQCQHLSVPQDAMDLLLDYSVVDKTLKKRKMLARTTSNGVIPAELDDSSSSQLRNSWTEENFSNLSQDGFISTSSVGWTMNGPPGRGNGLPVSSLALSSQEDTFSYTAGPKLKTVQDIFARNTSPLTMQKSLSNSSVCSINNSLGRLNPANVASWTKDDVAQLLLDSNLQQFVGIFLNNEVDGECLLSLDHSQLKEDLGIAALGHRHKILKLVGKLGLPANSYLGRTPPNTPI